MRRVCFVCLFPCLIATFLLSQSNPIPLTNPSARVMSTISASPADPNAQARILGDYGKLPLSFEANHGQADERVKFLSRTGGYTLFLTGDEAVLALSVKRVGTDRAKIAGASHAMRPSMSAPKSGGVLRMKLRNANPVATIAGVDELAGTSNYFIGSDPRKWRTGVPTYAKIKYEGIYSGVDLVYYGNQRQLEYDFIVAPGADPRRIAFDVSGAKRIRRDEHGDLVFKVGESEIRWQKPVVYQEKNGTRNEIAAHYAITDTNRVGFELAKYDPSRPLYIDPLIYSTYLGGSGGDSGASIAVDAAGNAYVTGTTASTNFPTMNPLQPTYGGGAGDAFVTKFNPSGSALLYSTYLGGSGLDGGFGIAVDSSGNAYLTGCTTSIDFPTMNPIQPNYGGNNSPNGGCGDAFVTEIDPAGSALVYSTYLGGSGSDAGIGVAVDGTGDAYVTGYSGSTNFPVTPGGFQTSLNGPYNAFVAVISPAGAALVYSTYLGGSVYDEGDGISVDNSDDAYVTGNTLSSNFPTTPGAFQTTYGGGLDAFVTKFNFTGSELIYSTYLGGSGFNWGFGVAVDSAGDAYVTGTADGNFPITLSAFQTTCPKGPGCAFVTKFNPSGSALVYSSYLGGYIGDSIALDSTGSAYIAGTTYSLQTKSNIVSKLNPSGSGLVYSTYLGGNDDTVGVAIAADSAGNAYVTGSTNSSSGFPVTPSAFQTTCNSSGCAFVTKLYPLAVTTTALTSSRNPSTYGQAVTLTAEVGSALGAPPDGETVSFMNGKTILGTATLSRGSASLTTSTVSVGPRHITAVYGGDSKFAGSTSNLLIQEVSKATTTTTLTSSQNPSGVGQSVTFAASLAPQFSGKVTGRVVFYDGNTALKTVPVSRGEAKFITSALADGTHNITATYGGSASFDGSSASLTQTVN
jgi:hypothetical protein